MLLLRLYVVCVLLICSTSIGFADTKSTINTSNKGMLQAVSLSEMNDWIREAMKKRVIVRTYKPLLSNGVLRPRLAKPNVSPVASAKASTTNIQEQGVDEADLVKTDGRYLYALNREQVGKARQSIRILDTQYQGNKLRQIAYVGFGDEINLQGMYFVPKQQMLVLIGSADGRAASATHLIYIDVKNKYKPKVLQRIKLDGQQNASRRVGDTLYLMLSNWLKLPQTYMAMAREKPLTTQEKEAYIKRLEVGIGRWDIKNKLPRYTAVGNKKPLPLIKDSQLYMDRGNPDQIYNMTVLLAIDLTAADFSFNSKAYFGYSGTFYASGKALYLSSHYYDGLTPKKLPVSGTVIHKFGYQGLSIDYRGSTVVPGQFSRNALGSFQLDENQSGHLRVVTYNWDSGRDNPKSVLQRSPVIMTVLSEHPFHKKLITLSQLPNEKHPAPLGKPGERLYGSRLFEDYAYFVTFKNTDPLYVVDMRNSWDINVSGKLIIPGFSDYLHPIGNGLLLGIGKSASNETGRTQVAGLKLSLFDVRDPRKPKEVDVKKVGQAGSFSPANSDPHAITVLPMSKTITRVTLPISATDKKHGKTTTGLHRFEINSKTQKIIPLDIMTPPDNGWFGSWSDRSVIIGNKLYYYHNNQFWVQNWRTKNDAKLIGR